MGHYLQARLNPPPGVPPSGPGGRHRPRQHRRKAPARSRQGMAWRQAGPAPAAAALLLADLRCEALRGKPVMTEHPGGGSGRFWEFAQHILPPRGVCKCSPRGSHRSRVFGGGERSTGGAPAGLGLIPRAVRVAAGEYAGPARPPSGSPSTHKPPASSQISPEKGRSRRAALTRDCAVLGHPGTECV